ncbi:hypothetical protein [Mesorhizobium sp. CAU 1732]|uniref:COG4223 family protein n=1 Tax=Mesorhizobium sp. CAU 1732 TaxID=3140358 RepID=UPI00326039D7
MIALVLGAGLQMAGLLPGAGSTTQERDPTISSLEAEMVQLRDQISALGAGASGEAAIGERVTQAEERLTALASEVETLRGATPQPNDGQPSDLAPLEERISAIETAIAGLRNAATPEANLAAIDDQITTLREDITTAREGQSAVVTRLDTLEQSVEGLTGRVDEQAETPGTAVIIAASALKAAIDRGTPFMTELETFATLAPDATETAELRDLAASGVPTSADIAGDAAAAANAMIAASRPVDPQASVVDRLWGSAMGLVQVRPVGMVEGEGVPETVARIDAAIGANDYARAITEFDTLPDAAKAAGEPFMAKVRAREAADRLIDQALATALKA